LPKQRRTKTGYSTGSDVLESLIAQGIDDPKLADRIVILPKILEMRQLTKLKNTYIDALPKLINPKTGRIHTSFNQTVTSTGRLSSSDPNLQNIPIRSELGQEIRRAFIPAEGCKLMSADYSQIELRILAHISGDASLISAFHRGEDIHTHTAMEIFGVSPEEVNPLMRRMAKIVNFGVIYGMSPYGLAKRLMIGVAQASKYIENYFARYGGVRDYIETIKEEARQKGYVTTLLNRRRYIPDIKSKSVNIRLFAERTAINTPIQGSAADMIKLAMIRIFERLKEENLETKMILQVHDELIFEVPEKELEKLEALVKSEMESAMTLNIPIKVDINIGDNWLDAK
jgi:DNA polymerase-1